LKGTRERRRLERIAAAMDRYERRSFQTEELKSDRKDSSDDGKVKKNSRIDRIPFFGETLGER
jgi:hypothetical protein